MLVFTADKSYLGACVCEREREADWQREMDVFQCRGRMITLRVQVESRFAFPVLDKVYAEHSVFEVVRGHSWRAAHVQADNKEVG